MIKYVSHAITFEEVPDEVCLTIQVSNCPHRCPGCHSSYLQEDIGEDLERDLSALLERYEWRASCVCFMGTGDDMPALRRCVSMAKASGFRACVYTGMEMEAFLEAYAPQRNLIDSSFDEVPDYVKTGPYVEALGGLAKETTNQRMLKCTGKIVSDVNGPRYEYKDVTEKFWKRYPSGR